MLNMLLHKNYSFSDFSSLPLSASYRTHHHLISIKDWTLWSVPSPELQLLGPTLLRSSYCSPSLWSVVVWLQRDSVLWHSLQPKTSKYFKQLTFNTLLLADDQFIISDTEDNLQKAVYLLYNISKEYNLEIATKKTKVFGFVGTDHLRTKIIINDETLEQVSQFT